MSIDLRVYGNLEEFSLNDAAYLFLERQPRDEYEYEPPKVVADMQRELNRRLSLLPAPEGSTLTRVDPQTGEFHFSSASRCDLIRVAEELGQAPKFLFPEMVEDLAEPAILSIQHKPLPTKRRNSYLKLIKGLLQKQGIDPRERGNIKILIGIVESAGQTLGKDAIGDILREVGDLKD
jgi:hypothetical protein